MTALRRIVVTREQALGRPWVERLTAAGLPALALPLLAYEDLAPSPDLDPAAFDWILFTSPRAVAAFVAAGLRAGRAKVGALGFGTAAALGRAGLRDDLGADAPDGAALAAWFTARVPTPARVLLPGPEKRLKEPRAGLEAAGFRVVQAALYRTLAVPPSALPADPPAGDDIVFFCSPSAVHAFTAAWSARPACVAIGGTTAAAAQEAGFPVAVAAAPDLDAMVLAAGLGPLPEPTATEMES